MEHIDDYGNPKILRTSQMNGERKKLETFDLFNRSKCLEKEYFEVARDQEREYLLYMRPLIVAPLCIACQWPEENIPLNVKAILKKKCPDNRATAFSSVMFEARSM